MLCLILFVPKKNFRVCFQINCLTSLKYLDISWNKLKFLPVEIKNLSLELIDVTAYNGDETIKDDVDQLLQVAMPMVKVGTLFEYAAAAILNYRSVFHQKNYLLLSSLKYFVHCF